MKRYTKLMIIFCLLFSSILLGDTYNANEKIEHTEDIDIHKNIEWLDYQNGIGELTFDLSSSTNHSGYDIVLAIDTSGSMNNSDGRFEYAKTELCKLIDLLLVDNNKNNNRISIVSYSSTATSSGPLSNDADALKSYVENLKPNGMTNYEDALIKSEEILKQTLSEDRIAQIIFISDGEPTSPNSGVDKAKELQNNGVVIHAIGLMISGENNGLMNLVNGYSNSSYVNVSSSEEMANAFNGVQESVTIIAKDITITETLSQEFTPYIDSSNPLPSNVTLNQQEITISMDELSVNEVKSTSILIKRNQNLAAGYYLPSKSSSLTYQNIKNESIQIEIADSSKITLPVGPASITKNYIVIDENQNQNIISSSLYQFDSSTELAFGIGNGISYNVTPQDIPSGYKLIGNKSIDISISDENIFEEVDFLVTPTVNTFTITNQSYGSFSVLDEKTQSTKLSTSSGEIVLPTVIASSGYKHIGWSTSPDGKAIDVSSLYTNDDMVFYPIFQAISTDIPSLDTSENIPSLNTTIVESVTNPDISWLITGTNINQSAPSTLTSPSDITKDDEASTPGNITNLLQSGLQNEFEYTWIINLIILMIIVVLAIICIIKNSLNKYYTQAELQVVSFINIVINIIIYFTYNKNISTTVLLVIFVTCLIIQVNVFTKVFSKRAKFMNDMLKNN